MGRLAPILFAAILVLGVLVVVPAPVAAQATQTLVEDFEDDTSLDPPVSEWYSFASTGTVSSFVTNAEAVSGTQSLRTSYATNDATARADFSGLNLCNGGEVRLWFKWSSFAASTVGRGTGFSIASGTAGAIKDGESNAVVVYVEDGTTSLKVDVKTSTGSLVTGTLGTVAANTWYDFRIYNINCASASVRVSSTTINNAVTVDHASGSITSLTRFKTGSQSATERPTGIHYVDDLELRDVPIPATPPPTVASDDSVVVDTLQGMAVSTNGQWLVTRQGGAVNAVVNYDAPGLAATGSDADDYCNKAQGVAAFQNAIFYSVCVGGGGNVDGIRLRDPYFQPPAKPPGCDNECPNAYNEADEGWNDAFDLPDTLFDLHTVYFYDYSTGGASGASHATTAFAYATETGKIGAVALTWNEPGSDFSSFKEIAFSSQAPDDTCFVTTESGRAYIGAVQEAGATAFYEVSVSVSQSVTTFIPSVQLTQVFFDNGLFGKARSISCTAGAEGDGVTGAVKTTAGQVRVFEVLTAGGATQKTLLFEQAATGTEPRAVALTHDEKFVMYVDGANAEIGEIATGNVTGSVTLATGVGAFKDIATDTEGTRLWVGHASQITVYPVVTVTCNDACGQTVVDDTGGRIDQPAGGSGGTSTGLGGDVKAAASTALGVSDTLAGAFVTMIIVVVDAALFAVPTFLATSKTRYAGVLTLVAGFGGFILGMVISYVLGVADAWLMIFLGVVLTAVAVLAVVFARR